MPPFIYSDQTGAELSTAHFMQSFKIKVLPLIVDLTIHPAHAFLSTHSAHLARFPNTLSCVNAIPCVLHLVQYISSEAVINL